MTRKEISQLIEKEMNGDWSITNWHNCDLKKCLVRPKRRNLNFFNEIKEVWIVLEENPETLEGYKVFFDETTKRFGLTAHSETVGDVYNSHDTFIAAFKAM